MYGIANGIVNGIPNDNGIALSIVIAKDFGVAHGKANDATPISIDIAKSNTFINTEVDSQLKSHWHSLWHGLISFYPRKIFLARTLFC